MAPRKVPCRRIFGWGYKRYNTIQCECCAGRFPNNAALANHRTLSNADNSKFFPLPFNQSFC
eukprot:scaffold171842_cov61-Attheya_sp.AAC.1